MLNVGSIKEGMGVDGIMQQTFFFLFDGTAERLEGVDVGEGGKGNST